MKKTLRDSLQHSSSMRGWPTSTQLKPRHLHEYIRIYVLAFNFSVFHFLSPPSLFFVAADVFRLITMAMPLFLPEETQALCIYSAISRRSDQTPGTNALKQVWIIDVHDLS
mgnify:CR=1 FL=1